MLSTCYHGLWPRIYLWVSSIRSWVPLENRAYFPFIFVPTSPAECSAKFCMCVLRINFITNSWSRCFLFSHCSSYNNSFFVLVTEKHLHVLLKAKVCSDKDKLLYLLTYSFYFLIWWAFYALKNKMEAIVGRLIRVNLPYHTKSTAMIRYYKNMKTFLLHMIRSHPTKNLTEFLS